MSHRSAPTAAASATADVSDPPRPSVVTRLSGPMPWKPVSTGTWPIAMRATSPAPSIPSIRARPWAPSVRTATCQPVQDRASTPIVCNAMATSPAVTCSPVATTASYSRASCSADRPWHQATSWLVTPAMAETTTITSCPSSRSRFTRVATWRIRPGSATEVPPNFITIRAIGRSMPGGLRNCELGRRSIEAGPSRVMYPS